MGTIQAHADYFHISKSDIIESGSDNRSVLIPVYGRVQAGIPIEAVQEILDYEEITPELSATGDYFALRIRGDSMGPRMCDGDVVIIKKQPDVDNGNIAVVIVNGQDATVKKLIKKGTSLMLVPLNSAYEPIIYTEDDIHLLPVTILGKVAEFRAKL